LQWGVETAIIHTGITHSKVCVLLMQCSCAGLGHNSDLMESLLFFASAEVWSPSGGWWCDPKGWRRNTAVAMGWVPSSTGTGSTVGAAAVQYYCPHPSSRSATAAAM
jgi:hypothetical protein